MATRYLDLSLTKRRQSPLQLLKVVQKCLEKHKYLHRFESRWPILDMLNQFLKNKATQHKHDIKDSDSEDGGNGGEVRHDSSESDRVQQSSSEEEQSSEESNNERGKCIVARETPVIQAGNTPSASVAMRWALPGKGSRR
ncbi:hypothetical protein BC835DRAFT_1311485 [Cytidiella melzeri]|nr:hypothetical protein BC835DRAFT_1311485 [Cytidiella melzeri]